MSQQQVKFTRASIIDREDDTSLIFEARVNNHEVATLVRIGQRWVVMMDADGQIIEVEFENVKKIVAEFSKFIRMTEENESDNISNIEQDESDLHNESSNE